jgi:hypothetical protein
MSIAGDPQGFVLRSEKATSHGTVVDKFASADWSITVTGRAGTQLVVQPSVALPGGGHGFAFGTIETAASSKTATAASSKTATMADEIADLGVTQPAAKAQAQAATQATPQTDCTGCFTDGLTHLWNNSGVCWTISQLSGNLAGTGCGFSYVDWQDPNNSAHWGLTSTYWVSITAYGGLHLWGVYWRMQWPTGNQITSEAPSSSVNSSGNCGSRTYSVDLKVPTTDIGMGESYTQDLCPNLYGPWNLKGVNTSLSSGAKWEGDQPPGVTMGVNGAQGVDSPPTAQNLPVQNYYLIGYGLD